MSKPSTPRSKEGYTELISPSDIEYTRLADQAAGLTEMMKTITHALPTNPALLIDVGCGTGVATCQLGTLYPTAQVYGIDLSPVPSCYKPANVEFIQGDIRQLQTHDPRLRPNSIDYVFSRLLVLGMTDWEGYVREMASLLRPGGWVEMQDFSLVWYLNGNPVSEEWHWMQALIKATRINGLDLHAGSNIKGYMQRAGLVDVKAREFRQPVGTWAINERPETKRIGEHSTREYPSMFYHAIPKMLSGMGYEAEEIEGFREECKKCLAAEKGKEICFYATVGRKP